MFKNALVSCSDKTNLAEFLKPLQSKGLRIVSTGGTSKYLRENGLKVVDVSEQTHFKEVMDGRVKTLHPNVHMALLARSENASDMQTLSEFGLEPFDLVIGNLYPFESKPSIETIDIGGPSFLRAAAKNFSRITVICDPSDYESVLKKSALTLEDRQIFAAKVFAHTSSYDAMISKYFGGEKAADFQDHALGGSFLKKLRYGENPQQAAQWYRVKGVTTGLHESEILQGKELSYNNILDLDAAWSTLQEFSEPTCVAVKHNNPCGVARGGSVEQAIERAIASDPQSVFGGIIALNKKVSPGAAEKLGGIFLECIVAPDYSEEALQILSKKKNLRLLKWPNIMSHKVETQYRSVSGGFLVQTADRVEREWSDQWTVVGKAIEANIKSELLMAWKVCAHLKSNAIAISSSGQTVGLGMGQVNRVDAVQQAIDRMRKFHPKCENPVLASDAFFPFPDSIEKIAEAGIRFVIQPGGSVKDNEVRAAAEKLNVTMVLTGQRHFLH